MFTSCQHLLYKNIIKTLDNNNFTSLEILSAEDHSHAASIDAKKEYDSWLESFKEDEKDRGYDITSEYYTIGDELGMTIFITKTSSGDVFHMAHIVFVNADKSFYLVLTTSKNREELRDMAFNLTSTITFLD